MTSELGGPLYVRKGRINWPRGPCESDFFYDYSFEVRRTEEDFWLRSKTS